MNALSVFAKEGGTVSGCANPIYLTSEVSFRPGDKLTFEVLEQDASQLKSLVGKFELFGLDSRAFFAQLVTLERCQSTVPALAMMRDRPTQSACHAAQESLGQAPGRTALWAELLGQASLGVDAHATRGRRSRAERQPHVLGSPCTADSRDLARR
jgi:hypothetical protein